MKNVSRCLSRRLAGASFTLAVSAATFGAQGCLDRPVSAIKPNALGVHIQPLHARRIDKVDLLIMIDNSKSMADKQSELGRRIPELVKALTNPDLDPTTGKPLYQAVKDIHIGVISSSLGAEGTHACGGDGPDNDHGRLLPRDGAAMTKGFVVDKIGGTPTSVSCPTVSALDWTYDGAGLKGLEGSNTLQAATSCVVSSVDETGCGYEHSLESVYHFLIDPAPWKTAAVDCPDGRCTGNIKLTMRDDALLAQRANFLRQDSLLAVLIVTDENDGSLRPEGIRWQVWDRGEGTMWHGSAGCANVPDDREAYSTSDYDKLYKDFSCAPCIGGADHGDPSCASASWAPSPRSWGASSDSALVWNSGPSTNLDPDGNFTRQVLQLQRFGYDFYLPRSRYVEGFTNSQVVGSDGKLGDNPIFAHAEGASTRTQSEVIVAAITGVPNELVWDEVKGAPKVLDEAAWDKIVSPDKTKRDPHMIESIAPRPGVPKFNGDRTVDPVNGGDRDVFNGNDLQYACIAKRTNDTPDKNSDCDDDTSAQKNPLCGANRKQPYFKAYPGLRQLRVIHELGPVSGFVASICNSSFSPAIRGIIDKLQLALNGECLTTPLQADKSTGNVNCLIIESFASDTYLGKGTCEEIGKGYCTPGKAPCREVGSDYPPIDAELAAEQLSLNIEDFDGSGRVTTAVKHDAFVDGRNVYVKDSRGKKHLVCEMMQLAGSRVDKSEADRCKTDVADFTPSTGGGWCYSQDENVVGAACHKIGAPGRVRFLGDTSPKDGSDVFTMCVTGGDDS